MSYKHFKATPWRNPDSEAILQAHHDMSMNDNFWVEKKTTDPDGHYLTALSGRIGSPGPGNVTPVAFSRFDVRTEKYITLDTYLAPILPARVYYPCL